ncbi:DNA recombination protein RmuC [Herbiconiux sp. VKM Ac-1786]|nr:DNA recombination protein RmuC [Herbiconiux sp. VKM Ac-1786]
MQHAVTAQADQLNLLGAEVRKVNEKLQAQALGAEATSARLRLEIVETFDGLRSANNERLEKIREAIEKLESSNSFALQGSTDQIKVLGDANAINHINLQSSVRAELEKLRNGNELKLEQVRESIERLQSANSESLQGNAERIKALIESNSTKHQELRSALQAELEKMRTGNEAKLEKMRETVDEKLQGTLEKRLGESFALVSERLEQVQKGLGEMQGLASDVGGLKRVLTNVKSRGTWGEVQLSRQLEDSLTVEQYERNVVVKPSTRESVEFAIHLPGRDQDSTVYLPIDSKLPQEDCERLLQAQEKGDKADIDAASKGLERAIVVQAKSIADKYINPPTTTDFAILYLPTEGLFAEVLRQPGLASRLQNDHRVLITGPTTLMALLNSLQMGFRTLAIEKRSSEVWQVLSAAKVEFTKYGKVWEKLGKQLQTAQNTVTEVSTRTRAVERRLRDVESGAPGVLEEGANEVVADDEIVEFLGAHADETAHISNGAS